LDNNDMAPRILAGDTVFVDRNRTEVEDAGVYLVMWSGKRYLRRLYNRPDGALLISSDSDRSQDFTVPADRRQSVSVVGRMVYFEAGDQV
jgi:phage repressor protein C with HTH and peptisase S24 domain